MSKLSLLAALVTLTTACTITTSEVPDDGDSLSGVAADSSFRFPAEWEPHESIWLSWPTYENVKGRPSQTVLMDIIRALEGHVKVDILAGTKADVALIQSELQASGVPTSHVRMHVVQHNDIWIRDTGANFLKNGLGELKIVDLNFNTWGYEATTSKNSLLEENVDKAIAAEMKLKTVQTKVVTEGGALEFNGQGTLISTEHVALQRNPGMTLATIEAEYKRLYNVKKVIWMKRGIMDDDQTFEGPLPGGLYTTITTGGHVDEFVRFIAKSTVLLAKPTAEERANNPIAAESGRRLDENRAILARQMTESGKPITIIDMPMADQLVETMKPGDGVYDYIAELDYKDGSTFPKGKPIRAILASSYLNYIVTNGVVIAPKYFKAGRPESTRLKDAEAKRKLEEAFPGRKVVQVDAENINLGGGGLHCITQQQPATKNAARP